MPGNVLSTENLEYLQRSGLTPPPLTANARMTRAPLAQRRLAAIRAIGRLPDNDRRPNGSDQELPPVTEGLLAGAATYEIPLAFLVGGIDGELSVRLGTWSPKKDPAGVLDRRQSVVESILTGIYPSVRLEAASPQMPDLPRAGFVLGVPTRARPAPEDDATQLDRLVRVMGNGRWAFLVLAQPVRERFVSDLRSAALNEARAVDLASQMEGGAAGKPSPLAEQLLNLLGTAGQELTKAQSIGAWRTGVYLLGDDESYYRLTSAWRATFAGERSIPEPIRVWDLDRRKLAGDWALADVPAAAGPGVYRHPFEYQTLLSSAQLASYIHLPAKEAPGFAIDELTEFQIASGTEVGDDAVALGSVVNRGVVTGAGYGVPLGQLSRHTFVAGVTGSGKTNTMFHILSQLAARKTPFLVIEPAKTEYRSLLRDPQLKGLRVFTLGIEPVAPLRLNPFEVPDGTAVAVHLDLLRSVFAASFGMWTPLPQVLEEALHRVYEERGWDLTLDTNSRLDPKAPRWAAWPTLSDLLRAVESVVAGLGYEARTRDEIRAALRVRLNSLRTGGKGRMFDVDRSTPMADLLAGPTVLELEGMGDDDDKAFLMGLVLIRLAEHRRASGPAPDLRHVLVIEEAHRLLARSGPRNREEQADARGKAVETFANLLAEVRAYGQGIIVADQIPAKLAPEVIKSTNLKIAHRVVADDDREALGGSMAMNDSQTTALSRFSVGEAAVFREGDDGPILVRIPFAKGVAEGGSPSDTDVARRMQPVIRDWAALGGGGAHPELDAYRDVARPVTEDAAFRRVFARLVQSAMEDPAAIDRLWPELMQTVRAKRPVWVDEKIFTAAVVDAASDGLASRRGMQARWSYSDTLRFAARLQALLRSKVEKRPAKQKGIAFQRFARALHARTFDPYPRCSSVCTQRPVVCLYRQAAADLVESGDLSRAWGRATADDATAKGPARARSWSVAKDAAFQLIEWPADGASPALVGRLDEVGRRAGLCFAQQMILGADRHPRTALRIIDGVLRASGVEPEGGRRATPPGRRR